MENNEVIMLFVRHLKIVCQYAGVYPKSEPEGIGAGCRLAIFFHEVSNF